MQVRLAQQSDRDFLDQMHYEAVYWRASETNPSFDEAMAQAFVNKALANWAEREGDLGVIATVNGKNVGAAWLRYWHDDNTIRGYVNSEIPVLVIGIESSHRHQGVGTALIEALIEFAAQHGITKISLSVSKDNYAINLYRQQGFLEHEDIDDSYLMIRSIE